MIKSEAAKKELDELDKDCTEKECWAKFDQLVKSLRYETFKGKVVPRLRRRYAVVATARDDGFRIHFGNDYIIFLPTVQKMYISATKEWRTQKINSFESKLDELAKSVFRAK